MNKPLVAALASFVGWSLGSVGVSYAKTGELNLGIAISGGLVMAFVTCVSTQWRIEEAERRGFAGWSINYVRAFNSKHAIPLGSTEWGEEWCSQSRHRVTDGSTYRTCCRNPKTAVTSREFPQRMGHSPGTFHSIRRQIILGCLCYCFRMPLHLFWPHRHRMTKPRRTTWLRAR